MQESRLALFTVLRAWARALRKWIKLSVVGLRLNLLKRRRFSRSARRHSSDHHGTGIRFGRDDILGVDLAAALNIVLQSCSFISSVVAPVMSNSILQSAVKLVQSAFRRFHCGVLAPGWGISAHSQMGKWSLPQGDAWVRQRNRSATEAELRDKSIADVDPDGRAICVWEPVLSMHILFLCMISSRCLPRLFVWEQPHIVP